MLRYACNGFYLRACASVSFTTHCLLLYLLYAPSLQGAGREVYAGRRYDAIRNFQRLYIRKGSLVEKDFAKLVLTIIEQVTLPKFFF